LKASANYGLFTATATECCFESAEGLTFDAMEEGRRLKIVIAFVERDVEDALCI
jgi:hypothetical protein